MSRIVLTTIGSFGDLHPKIAIAPELQQRSHEVVFATHKEYQDKIAALEFEFHRMRPDNTALNDPQETCRIICIDFNNYDYFSYRLKPKRNIY
ncbi:MAG: glycosyltransferase [Desmonostoc vinosum HA7617-LM4]|jgi:UDP:flavonoid glycosyltransferase YjiC (YdhE family)|nr:glycosyltransferase [Desmonostoc vinosum HA7617-LM4]